MEEPSINPIECSELYKKIREVHKPISRKNTLKKWVSSVLNMYQAMPLELKEEYRQQCVEQYTFDILEYLQKPDVYISKFKTTVIKKNNCFND